MANTFETGKIGNTYTPTDITLPEGWTWDSVEAARIKWGVADNMVPIASAAGVVAWGTIASVRAELAAKRESARRVGGCTGPHYEPGVGFV